MKLNFFRPRQPSLKRNFGSFAVMALIVFSISFAKGQISKEEHESHHPEGEGEVSAEAPAKAGGGMMGGKGGGMMSGKGGGGMGGMMEKMGAPKPKDIYPTMMNLPELTPEKRIEVQKQADKRVRSGTALMGKGIDALSKAAARDNHAAMQKAVATVREGLGQLDSGLAARRALTEGKAPKNIALNWFKREMNLLPSGAGAKDQVLGGSVFHLFTMVLLVAFALAMLLLYFFKMRRAIALFARVEPGEGPPPPGSIAPLVGEPGPSGAKSKKAKPSPEKPPASSSTPKAS